MTRQIIFLIGALISGGCAVVPSLEDCEGATRFITINITHQNTTNMAFVQVAPKLATKAERGQLIRFKINGPAGPQVTVAGKSTDPDADWIAGSANSGSFFVCVPMSTTVGEDYEYEIDVNGIGFLDPEVRIKK